MCILQDAGSMNKLFNRIKNRVAIMLSGVEHIGSNDKIPVGTDGSRDYSAMGDLKLDNWSAAAIAFFVPAVIFFVF